MEATVQATAVTLPDDVIVEILVRVTDEATLFRCATACKPWRCLIADPCFLRRRWPDNACHPSSLLGFFDQQQRSEAFWLSIPVGPALEQAFVPGPRSVFGPGRRSLPSFVPNVDCLFDRVISLTSRCGLLLVRFVPRCAPVNQRLTVIHLAVCNPLVGTCDVLPPLEYYKSSKHNILLNGFVILSGADFHSNGQQRLPSSGYSAFFKVLIIVASPNGDRDLYTFSSDHPSWSPRNCLDLLKYNNPLGQGNAVVRQGTVHWLYVEFNRPFHSLDVNAETGHVSFTELPIPENTIPENRFSFHHHTIQLRVAPDGMLSVVFLRKDLWLEIWTRRDSGDNVNDSANWVRTRVIDLDRHKQKGIYIADSVCLGEKSGTLLINVRGPILDLVDHETGAMSREVTGRYLYLVNLETGASEDVIGQFRGLLAQEAVPVEIDWPAFFISRLGRR